MKRLSLLLLVLIAPLAQASIPEQGKFDIEKIYVSVTYGRASALMTFVDYVNATQPDVQSVLVRILEESDSE